MQKVYHDLQQAHLPEDIFKYVVVPCKLQKGFHRNDATVIGGAGLQEDANANEFFTRDVIQAKNDKLQHLKVFVLYFREFRDLLCKLRQGMLGLQDEVISIVGHVNVRDGVEDDLGKEVGLCF